MRPCIRSTTTGFVGLGYRRIGIFNPGQVTSPDNHRLDLDPLPIPGIIETATVSFVHGFSTLRTMEPQYQPPYYPTVLGCCDCGGAEAWKTPIGCPHCHAPVESSSGTPKVVARSITDISGPQSKSDSTELLETIPKTVAYALGFPLDIICSVP